MVKLICHEVIAEVSADLMGSSEAGMALQKCPRLRRELGSLVPASASHCR